MKPEIRFPEFSGEWAEKKLGDIFIIKRGASPRPIQNYLAKNGVNWIKIGDIETNAKYITKTQEKIIPEGAKKSVKVYPNDFVLSNSMSFGRPYISKIEGCIHDGWLLLRKKVNNINIEFLYYNLLTSNTQKSFLAFAAGSTVNNLKADSVKKIKIHIPPTLTEQEKIAEFLSSIDEKIEITAKKIEKLKDYKKGLLQKMLNVINGEPEIRFKEFSGKWVKVKIKEIFDKITRGNVLSIKKISKIRTNIYKYPVYSSQTLNNGLMGFYNEYLYENAITWTTDGANAGDVKFRKGKFYCTNVSGVLISSKGYANQCIAEILNMNTKKYVSYTGNPKLMNNVMADIKIYIPPTLEEQQKIADFLSSIDEKIELNENRLKALKTYKKGLLQKIFV